MLARGDMYNLEIEIKGLPKLANSLLWEHWSVKQKHNAQWKLNVSLAVGRDKPESPLKKAKIELTRFSSNEPDFDGLVSSFKAVLDGLKGCGVIEDDKVSVIGQPVYKWERAAPKAGKIKIRVEEAG